MPKKSFKSSTSTVLIKRKRCGQIKNKISEKRSSKLILIDESSERDWKFLKTELGYKSDASFVDYLLKLARKDLESNRQKKKSSDDNGKLGELRKDSSHHSSEKNLQKHKPKVFESVHNIVAKNVQPDARENTSPYFRAKSQAVPVKKEKEEKKTKARKIDETLKVTYDNQLIQTNVNDIKLEINKNEKTNSHFREKDLLSSSQTRSSKLLNNTSAQNLKTDIAKDVEIENASVGTSEKLEDLEYTTQSEHPFYKSDTKDLNQHENNLPSQGQKIHYKKYFQEKNVSDMNNSAKSTDESQVISKTDNENSIIKGKHRKKRKDYESDGKERKHKKLPEKETVEDNDHSVQPLRVAIKIKLCLLCNTRHIIGKCPEQMKNCSSESVREPASPCLPPIIRKEMEEISGEFPRNDGRNIYDFDENDKESYMGYSNTWCPKTAKLDELPKENVEPYSIEMSEYNRDGMSNVDVMNMDRDTDSDSSNSGLKLRIDESFGENISFAESSLPDYLVLKILDDEHGSSVFTKMSIKKSSQFGPMLGQKMKEMDIPDDFNMKDIWEVNSKDGVSYICTRDPETSNWLRFLRPAASKDIANVMSAVKDGRLYFLTTRDVCEGEELVYWIDDTHSAWSKKKMDKKNCGGCNIQFSHPLYYRKHCTIFHDPSCSLTIRKYHCKVCGLAVLGKEKIMKHAAEMHQGKGAYQCQYCHKFFLRLNYLEMHRTYGCSKNPQRSRPLCDLCGRKFCQPQKLKVHIKRMHSDMAQVLKDFQCKSCLKILGSRAALQRHMKEVHNKDIVGACTCDRCGKMFQNKSNLKIHMLTHSGVKPFKCQQEDCTAAFTTKQCLQFHYKKVHGFTDGFIPKIERSIAYTFDAYSGGVVSEPIRGHSPLPKLEELNSSSSLSEKRDCGLDLSLALPSAEDDKEKSLSRPPSPLPANCHVDDQNSLSEDYSYPGREETDVANTRVKEEEDDHKSAKHDQLDKEHNVHSESKINKMIVSKGSKKWMGSAATVVEKSDSRFKSIFRPENASASLLVEAAISAAEKDIIDKTENVDVEKDISVNGDSLIENPSEIYSINQYISNSPGVIYESSDKKLEEYDKMGVASPKSDSFHEAEKKSFVIHEKSNVNDILKCNTLLRINTTPLNEIPKDYNINSIIRDHETESFTDIEIHDYRNRDLLETYKENETFHEPYRTHDLYRSEKLDLYRNSESEFRLSDKFECRDIDLSNECYRNLANNLEKYRTSDMYRLRNEGYDLGAGYRELSEERDGEVQNLCLKEKSLQLDLTYKQYETLEELARMGRDNPGFECLLVGDSSSQNANQGLGVSMPRGLHGMLSPRSYHPPSYEPESVDLSVPRPSYPSPPKYTLDLTPTRLDLPTARHIDFRSHLGLSPHRFQNTRVVSSGSSPVSPTGYSVYPSPYVTPTARPSPTSQFQPYTSLYY